VKLNTAVTCFILHSPVLTLYRTVCAFSRNGSIPNEKKCPDQEEGDAEDDEQRSVHQVVGDREVGLD